MFRLYAPQRFCVWLVALAGTKLTNRNEPLGNYDRNFQVHTD